MKEATELEQLLMLQDWLGLNNVDDEAWHHIQQLRAVGESD